MIWTLSKLSAETIQTMNPRKTVLSWIGSATLHLAAIVVATQWTMSRWDWETNVDRGESSTIVLTMNASAASLAVPLTLDFSLVEVPQHEPAGVTEELKRKTKPSQILPPIPTKMPELISVESEVDYKQASEPLKQPRVEDLSPKRLPRKRPVERPLIAAAVPDVAVPEIVANQLGARIDSPPKKLPNNAPPIYPTQARLSSQQGRVVLNVTVDKTGAVTRLSVATSSGFALLDQAAMDAVAQWRFEPAVGSGSPVASDLRVPVRFSLRSQ